LRAGYRLACGRRRPAGYAWAVRLVAIAVATALAYAVWVVWVPLLPGNLYIPLLDLGKITGYTPQAAAMYLGLVLVLYALYTLGYRQAQHAQFKTTLALSAVFCAELLFAYPATAVDVFAYIADGRLLAGHAIDPFVNSPNQFPFDPIVKYLAYPGEPSQYGPLWVLLSGGIALLAHGDLLAEILLYKAVGAAAHLVSGVLVYVVALQLTHDEHRARRSGLLFLWNPMLLWEMVANAHNDGLMMLGGLAAAWLLVSDREVLVLPSGREPGRRVLVLPALAAGGLIKLPVIAVAPLLFVALWRRRPAAAVESAALAAVLAAVMYRPFWAGPQTLTALRRTDLFTASLASVLRLGLAPALGLDNATAVARTTSLTIFVVVAVLALLMCLRARSCSTVPHLAYATLLAAALFGTTWFQAWYVVWPFAFAAPLPEVRRHVEVALLSLGGLLQYFVFIYLWVMGVWPLEENIGVQLAAYVALIGPLVLGSLAYARFQPKRELLTCKPS
jgi:alpha-1,6-mannosyltransferase